MNAYVRSVAALSVLGLLLTASASARAADETHDGKVKSATAEKLVITVADKEHTFKVDATTKITLNGKESKATDLKAGDAVKVTSKQAEGGGHLATKIEATRK